MKDWFRLSLGALVLAGVACGGQEQGVPHEVELTPDVAQSRGEVSEDVASSSDLFQASDVLSVDQEPSLDVLESGAEDAQDEGGEQGIEDAFVSGDLGLPEGIDASGEVSAPVGALQSAWGEIFGACGQVGAALVSGQAQLLQTEYSFDDPESFKSDGLEPQALKRYEEPNAGGSSRCSEVMSMQLLIDCEAASVVKTETEMSYDVEGKIADYLVEIEGVRAGVSVTRAYKGPMGDVYSQEDASELLTKKLDALIQAQSNVSEGDSWEVSLLHVWTLHASWAATVASAWEALDAETKADHVVLITTELGSDYIVTDACHD